MSSSLQIIVTGLITQHPLLGGITWHYLQYVLGLARLGHQVYYFEDSGERPYLLGEGAAENNWTAKNCDFNVGYLAKIMARFGFEERWAYRCALDSKWYGLSRQRRESIITSADLLINVSGSLENPANYRQIPHLLYIDTDPVVTQIKIAAGNGQFARRVAAHDIHFSFGESFSESVPSTDYRWRPTRQPIDLSLWRPDKPRRETFTTIMSWTSYAPLTYAGRTFGQKDAEFVRFLELPRRVASAEMEIALGGAQHRNWQVGDQSQTAHDLLTEAGWRIVDALETCADLDSYRHYIESSKAEWSVAKNAYVQGRPGWFSERSACYLAAGRPVVVQDTGFGAALPVGEGILPFSSLEQAVAAILEVQANYGRHAEAARAIAETHFACEKVLARLIDQALNDDGRPGSPDILQGPGAQMTAKVNSDQIQGTATTNAEGNTDS